MLRQQFNMEIIDHNLICIETKGRMITSKGHEYLKNLHKNATN